MISPLSLFTMKQEIIRGSDGAYILDKAPKSFNPIYADAIVRYLNYLDPLFEKAQKISEFEFVMALIRFRGIQNMSWDPYENSKKVFQSIMDLEKRLEGDAKLNIILWLYGHIVESSEPYETIANLINIVSGGGYKVVNFPKIKMWWGYRNWYPSEKIKYLQKRANSIGMPDVLVPIIEVFDKDLRNSIVHSDYSVNNGEIILVSPSKLYSREETLRLTNRALAYHEVVSNIIDHYTTGYSESKKINVSPGFSQDSNMKATIIVRQGDGVVGIKDAWTQTEIRAGKIPFFVGTTFSYEQVYLKKGEVLLPPNRVKFWNGILKRFPKSIAKGLRMFVENKLLEIPIFDPIIRSSNQ